MVHVDCPYQKYYFSHNLKKYFETMNENTQYVGAGQPKAADASMIQRVKEALGKPFKNSNAARRTAAVAGGAVLGVGSAFAASQILSHDDEQPAEDAAIKVTAEDDSKTFDEAFNDARAHLGPGAAFQWHGGLYSTYTEEEWNGMSDEERSAYTTQVNAIATGSETHADTYAHNAMHEHHGTDSNVHRAVNDGPAKDPVTPAGQGGMVVNSEEEYTLSDGTTVIRGEGLYDGKPAVFVDIDRDGKYDAVIVDSNGSGNLDDGDDVIDIRDSGLAVHDSHLIAASEDPTFEIHEVQEMEVDGQMVYVAKATYGGHDAVLMDRDHDGVFDVAMVDTNGDGQLQEDEMYDISSMHVSVADAGAHVIPASNVTTDDGVTVNINEEGHTEIEGRTVIVGAGTVNGHQAAFVDVDADGKYDRAIIDVNDDGEFSDDESVDLRGAGVNVEDRSLVDPNNGIAHEAPSATDANLDNPDDNLPDYVNNGSADGGSTDGGTEDTGAYMADNNMAASADGAYDPTDASVFSPDGNEYDGYDAMHDDAAMDHSFDTV